MFEARLVQGKILKQLIDALKDLVTEANFDCNSTGISLQAMDSSHVSLVTFQLRSEGFQHYRADRNLSLGINIKSLAAILKCAGSDDVITLKAEDSGDNMTFMFENPKQDRVSHFTLKLMDIDSEHLGIPDTEYKCVVKMPSGEFKRICNEIQVMGDTVEITANKEGIKFQAKGDIGSGSIMYKQSSGVDEEEKDQVMVKVEEEVNLTFALRYLNNFAKASSLSDRVTLQMSADIPLAVEYKIEDLGQLRFFLAPKIDEGDS